MTTNEPVNWNRIADRYSEALRVMVHEENWPGGPDFYAEALRRTFGYHAANEPGISGRVLAYDHLLYGEGLITEAEAKYRYAGDAILERMSREKAEQQVKELREELRRVYREAGKDLAELLRHKCNERSVPSRYRREGVAWAADMIDPSVPKDRYGNLAQQPTEQGAEVAVA